MSTRSVSLKPRRDDPRRRLGQPRSLLWRGFQAWLIFTIIVFGALYTLTIPDGPWLAVVITHVVAIAAAIAASVSYFRSAIWIGANSPLVTERGFFFGRLTHFDKSDATLIVRSTVFTSDGLESRAELSVMGHNDRRLLRMRGQYWAPEDFEFVASHFNVPVETIPGTVSHGEIRRDYPETLYTYERYPLLVVAIAIGTTAAVAGVFAAALTVIKALAR
ncbi:hypothetical protein I6E68_11805 [Salinibacterium sp. NSLL150]|nr:hypothetical protein [Salinibacterium sp. NSLL35]MBH0102573.1 hypothetical protein [Salinibacterium sp. NSLL150]MBH0105333.1 hypothetical protein [Salinibacterium sp. NSLL16]MBH0108093.1 hypothetical protein [Salinibacterium sp. NSLL17]